MAARYEPRLSHLPHAVLVQLAAEGPQADLLLLRHAHGLLLTLLQRERGRIERSEARLLLHLGLVARRAQLAGATAVGVEQRVRHEARCRQLALRKVPRRDDASKTYLVALQSLMVTRQTITQVMSVAIKSVFDIDPLN